MTKYLLIFLLPFTLYASKILSYNIYERTDRADIMLTFDTPFTGTIKQSTSPSSITIKLDDASIESPKVKNVTSKFLHSLTITPMKDEVQIIAQIPESVRLIASKTSDAYGLRLRFTEKPMQNDSTKTANSLIQKAAQNPLAALPTKKDDGVSSSYYIVLVILVLGILILFFLKRKIQMQGDKKIQNGWLFKQNEDTAPQVNSSDVSIRFQKTINESSSVVMLDFGTQSYLVLMGNSNILLDKFTDDRPTSQQEFESILQNRHQELENFLGESSSSKGSVKEPLQAYKERAASLIYSEETY
jgi:hypothetical protein